MIESELCKGLFTKTRIVLSLVRWFFFLFSPLLSIGLVNTMVILQCRRRKTALQLQSVCVCVGVEGVRGGHCSKQDSLLPPYKFPSLLGELNSSCCAVTAVERDWWRVDGQHLSHLWNIWLGLSALMLWKLTGWHRAYNNICTRFLNVCVCKRKLIDKRQRVGIQPSTRKVGIHGNYNY